MAEVVTILVLWGTAINAVAQTNKTVNLAESCPSATLAADGSRIHLSVDTLFTTKPTLAALAY